MIREERLAGGGEQGGIGATTVGREEVTTGLEEVCGEVETGMTGLSMSADGAGLIG